MGEFEIEVFIEKEDAGFALVKEFDIGDIINNEGRMHLLDSCSRFGNVFVGRKFGFDVYSVTELETNSDSPKPLVKVSLKGKLQWLTVSSCGLTLLASTVTEGKSENIFYDVRTLMKGGTGYFGKQSPPTSPSNGALLSCSWNPSIAEIITMVYSSGVVEVLKVEDTVMIHASNPGLSAKCVAWSPKGKQMVIGKGDGSMSQYTTDMVEKKKITPCPLINGNAKVIDVAWISTYKFGVAYADETADAGANLFTVHLPEKGETRQPIWRCFDDPTFAANCKRDSQMFLPLIIPWGMFAVTSSNSGDCALMGTKTKELQVWSLADEARAELPLGDDSDETPSVIGACWNFNFNIPLQIGEKSNTAPCLWVLSTTGVLVAFRLYNFFPNYAEQHQLIDSMVKGERKTISVEETPQPRMSIPKPLQRTNSIAQPVKESQKPPFGNNTILFVPPLASTPATVKAPDFDRIPSFSILNKPMGNVSVLPKPEPSKPQPKPVLVSKPIVLATPKEALGGLSQIDLASLVADFESELDLYKKENKKVDISVFNDTERNKMAKQTEELDKFAQIVRTNFQDTKDEADHLKLRSLESFATYEAARDASKKKSFKAQAAYSQTAPLCPTLSKQLESIRALKRYVNDSIYDIQLILKEKATNNKENFSMRDFYKCMETNQRVLHMQESRMVQLGTQLNRVRLAQSASYTKGSPLRRKSEEDSLNSPISHSPRSPMKPEHISKLKKQLSARKNIPIRSKAVIDTTKLITNRKPQTVINQSSFNHTQENILPKFDNSPVTPKSQESGFQIQRTGTNVVSYLPTNTKSPLRAAEPFRKAAPNQESRYNLNNPPQVINADTLPQAKGPFAVPLKFVPAPHVNQGTQNAVQAALNTVNKIASVQTTVSSKLAGLVTPEKSPDQPKSAFSKPEPFRLITPSVGGFKATEPTSQKSTGGLFFHKTEPPKNEDVTIKKDPPKQAVNLFPSHPQPTGGFLGATDNPFASVNSSSSGSALGSSKQSTTTSITFRTKEPPTDEELGEGETGDSDVETDVGSEDDVIDETVVESSESSKHVSMPEPRIFAGPTKSGGLFGSKTSSSTPSPNMFDAINAEKPAPTQSSLFGSKPKDEIGSGEGPQKPTFSQTGGSLFGSSSDKPASSGSLFGSSSDKPASTGSLFGPKPDEKAKPGLFGSLKDAAKSSGSGLFGSKKEDPSSSGSLFAPKKVDEKKAEGLSGNLFGSSETKSSLFGTPSKPEQPKSGLFGSSITTPSTGGLFGTPKPEVANTGGIFGSNSAESSTGTGLFGSNPQDPPSATSIFGSASQSSGTGLFGSSIQAENTSVFGSTPQKPSATQIFATPAPTPNKNSGSSLFGSSNSGGNGGNLFGSGGGFSGLGAQPDPEKAKINPFGGGGNNMSTNNQATNNLFGSSKPASFGQATSPQQNQNQSGPFSGGSGTSAFASPSTGGGVFGGSTFGSSSPSSGFGGGAFGGGQNSAFGNSAFGGGSGASSGPFGSTTTGGSVFGSNNKQQSSSGFGGFGGGNSGGAGGFGAQTQKNSGGFGGFGGASDTSSFGGTDFDGFR